MKGLFTFLAFILLLSCSKSFAQVDTLQARIDTVIQDSLYYEYQMALLKSLGKEYDTKELMKAAKEYKIPECDQIETADPPLPQNFAEFLKDKCESRALYGQLAIKYPDIFCGNIELEKINL